MGGIGNVDQFCRFSLFNFDSVLRSFLCLAAFFSVTVYPFLFRVLWLIVRWGLCFNFGRSDIGPVDVGYSALDRLSLDRRI